jgi:glycosyltransferase involved in cell wall biosynthesis
MRVLQLGPFPPPNGGVQTNLKAIHDLLGERGHDAAVIAITRTSQTEGVPNVYKPRSVFELLKLLLTHRFDIVHFHVGGDLNFRLATLMLVCGLLPNRKAVVTFHSGGYAAEAVHFAKPFSWRGFAFRSLDFVIGVNAQMLEMFRCFGVKEQKMRLILPYVLQKPKPNLEIPEILSGFAEKHQPFLLTVGLLEKEYALSLQIEALEPILTKFPNAGLMILGSGSLEKELRELIEAKKYREKIFLTGDVEREITIHLIERADLLLRPTYFDGDAVSVREALFLRTPVIATDNGMRPNGVNLISLPPRVEILVEKIFQVLTNKVEQNSAENFGGWENIEAVLNVYEELLKQ